MAICKFCSKEIFWMKEGRKNRPVELDGALHECDEMKQSFKSVKVITPGTLSPEEIAKYEQDINKAHEKYKDRGKKKPKPTPK